MINSKELIFVVDENNQPLDPQIRSDAHKNRLWHRTSGIWVFNKQKQILCQKRSMKKDTNPGLWEAFFGGHLAPNESYLHNAKKELGEELGISVDEEKLVFYGDLKSDKQNHKEFQGSFAYFLDRKDVEFPVEEEEVDELKWIDIEELRKILLSKESTDWVHKSWDKDVLDWIKTL